MTSERYDIWIRTEIVEADEVVDHAWTNVGRHISKQQVIHFLSQRQDTTYKYYVQPVERIDGEWQETDEEGINGEEWLEQELSS